MGRIALVTGAGSGIGRATTIALSRAGYQIVLVGRREAPLRETAAMSSAARPQIITADLASPDGPARVIEETIARSGGLDVLVNNAGIAESAPLPEITQALLDRMFAINAFAPAHLIARAWPVFLQRGGGCVVNVSSMSTLDPFPGLGAYGAAKAALESLTRSINTEGRLRGIRGFTVAPGAVETAMLRGLVSADELPPERTLDPAQVAEVIVDCVEGRLEQEIGRVIRLPSPSTAAAVERARSDHREEG